LDRLRRDINVVWIFTTNLVEYLDPAFLDRCRLKEVINAPVVDRVYEMLRAEINAKIRQGEIVIDTMIYGHPYEINSAGSSTNTALIGTEHLTELPSLDWATRYWPPAASTAVLILQRIATLAADLSGRNLRGLLDAALFKYWVDAQPNLLDALTTLEIVARKETDQSGKYCLKYIGEERAEDFSSQEEHDDLPVKDTGASVGLYQSMQTSTVQTSKQRKDGFVEKELVHPFVVNQEYNKTRYRAPQIVIFGL
jgi:hypothetical protein